MSVKSSVLGLLEMQKGVYVSGEDLAARFSCSRAAVWKAISALRKEGYPIHAVTNKGYILEPDSNLLSSEAILAYSDGCLAPVWVYPEVTSTNLVLRQKALESDGQGCPLSDGAMVLAESQSAGRGHLGRGFYSPKDTGLYLSILYHPKRYVSQSRVITAAAAVAVYTAVSQVCSIDLDIKWVNDLYFRRKKVCGILTEAVSSFETGEIEFVIVGIGLNLREPDGGFPSAISRQMGAITPDGRTADGVPVNRSQLAAQIRCRFLELADCTVVPEIYRSHNLVLGQDVLLTGPDGHTQPAKALTIEFDGSLTCRMADGSLHSFPYGDIRLTE